MNTRLEPTWSNPHRRHLLLLAGLGAVGIGWLPGMARAQGWPSKPIRLIAAQAPGSSNDATARALAEYLTMSMGGAPVVVENKPGAIGMIAAEYVARSAADGHTLLITLHSQLAQAPVLLKKVPLDTSNDLVPIAAFSTGVAPMVVRKDLPVKNLKELIALSRTRPISVGNYGIGSGWHLMISALAQQTGGKFDIINYKGTGPMVLDLMAGHIDMGAGSMAGMGGAIAQGAARPILSISGTRSDTLLPGVPTWADEGFVGPAFQYLIECNMVLAPKGTPKAIVDRVAGLAHASFFKSDRLKTVMAQLGVTEPPWTGDELGKLIKRTWPQYQAMTRELGLTME
ncbi:Bug family tripartite tricarboxylate transporter substrate binding protein [Verminephrobacter eiseniae]|uniref:Bug family tripartite tricarboxylate transporter substrate binding protein n=1 Tax=Verminephrobacter eiseniae TaxID=364317 RepID=UPI002237BF58|nr:tripartite tricarboxylate transporter substrate binding protein [Verminephrobacter eiseniae]MCW5234767.1 tripartite tricarboxylate transporter substrate binding protein [Verminephrobacter eiseniae]MCW5294080.1 tripartite tricarboxylate transporter substrate binding protein [Verminephrobacter eiseniae]MCW8183182.1 tripartite tricarboxylate transporter substrate binding protein [Verminephrobacter eiseniae]MCW8222123.1 tripartite tricarboxylate transporter substrate binding protein [Verminephro